MHSLLLFVYANSGLKCVPLLLCMDCNCSRTWQSPANVPQVKECGQRVNALYPIEGASFPISHYI